MASQVAVDVVVDAPRHNCLYITPTSRTNCTRNAVVKDETSEEAKNAEEKEENGKGLREAGEMALFRAPAPESREPGPILEESPVLLERGSPSTCE